MKLRLAVVFGGDSVEHEISIISATQVMAAVDLNRYELIPVYLSKQHRFYSDPKLVKIESYRDLKALLNSAQEVSFQRRGNDIVLQALKGFFTSPQVIDLVLPVVHGTFSEDGTLVGFLETLGCPYVGSDGIASAISQDKAFMKMAFAHAKLPMVPWFSVRETEHLSQPEASLKQAKALGYPVIVKPARLGSSIGIQTAHTPAELSEAFDVAFRYDDKVVVEVMVQNLREVNCSVLSDGQSVEASVLEEVRKNDSILSFQDKYESGAKSKGMASLDRIIPAPLNAKTTAQVQTMAKVAFEALGNQGVARIDFMIDAKTDRVYINEINTIPGSLSFYLWQKSGVDFTQLIDRLVQQGIRAQRNRTKRITSFDTNVLANAGASRKLGSKS